MVAREVEALRPEAEEAVLWWLGQAGFLVRGPTGPLLAVDPYLSDSCASSHGLERTLPVPVAPERLPAEVVLASHWHPDHLDPETIRPLGQASEAMVIGPPSCIRRCRAWGLDERRLVELRWGDTFERSGLRVEAVPARHMVPGALCEDANGYLLRLGDVVLYYTGDTEYDASMRQLEGRAIDVLMTCFNGTGGNLDPLEAGFLAARLAPALLVPMHFGMWRQTAATEPRPDDLVGWYRRYGGTGRVAVPEVGRPIHYRREEGR